MRERFNNLLSMMSSLSGKDPEIQKSFDTAKVMKDKGYKVRSLSCREGNITVNWQNNSDRSTQKIRKDMLQTAFPQGPESNYVPTPRPNDKSPVEPQKPEKPLPIAVDEKVDSTTGTLLGCDRNPDIIDLYSMLKEAGLTESVVKIKTTLQSGATLTGCKSHKPQVSLTFSNGATIDVDAGKIDPDFWL